MKKKSLFVMLAMMMATALSIGFTSCSSDDDDDNSSSSLVGTWYIEGIDHGELEYTEITYNKDLTCTYRCYSSDRTTLKESDTGTYKVEGNKLSIWWESEREYWKEDGPWTTIFSISGNKMTTTEGYGGGVWTKK